VRSTLIFCLFTFQLAELFFFFTSSVATILEVSFTFFSFSPLAPRLRLNDIEAWRGWSGTLLIQAIKTVVAEQQPAQWEQDARRFVQVYRD